MGGAITSFQSGGVALSGNIILSKLCLTIDLSYEFPLVGHVDILYTAVKFLNPA